MALLSYAAADASLLAALREEVATAIEPGSTFSLSMKKLEECPLLLSMYAETLRLGVQIHIPRHTPHQSLDVGHCTIPNGRLLFVNTWLAHTDRAVWNTKDGAFPLDRFWARRFLVDVKDPFSGPCKIQHGVEDKPDLCSRASPTTSYSTEGLEGTWIPYGGKIFRFRP